MYTHLLVPTDASQISTENVSAAVDFARGIGARITFFHASADFGATGEGALMHALWPAMFNELNGGDAHAILAKAEAAARSAGVSCRSISSVNDHAAEAILQAAEQERCDLIFMASRGATSVGGVMLGSQTLKVLAGTKIPVLVSQIARNAQHAARDSAIATIQDEHRSVAAVLRLLEHLVGTAQRSGWTPLDNRILRGALHYLRAFPEALHHPKEELYIFARLRGRSPELDRTLDELERQHVEGATLLDGLGREVEACEREEPESMARLCEALEAFALAQRQHIRMEEQVILPAAREHLSEHDWNEVAEAFGENGDPRFGADDTTDFRTLFMRLMNLAARGATGTQTL
jgi:hemerythrin-like domain-containing protein/nucleotide-binding universal stress UspA family protein